MQSGMILECALCCTKIDGYRHLADEEEKVFCCKGCCVVYEILKAQGALAGFKDHPVYCQALKAGLITHPPLENPALDEDEISAEEIHKFHLTIQNMWCPSCAQLIHLLLTREKGVRQCVVDYSTDLAYIEFSPRLISKEKILRLIEIMGYQPVFLQDPRQKAISRSLLLRFIVAAFFSLNVMMFAYPIYATYFDGGDGEGYAKLFAWLSLGGALPVLFYSAWPIWRRCYFGLKVGICGMEALVFLGVAAATGLSLYQLSQSSPYVYFDSVTVIILFVLLGKMIESRAKFSAKDALIKLSLALPSKGRKRFADGKEMFVPVKEIHTGDLLVVRMGEKIILDGLVEEGSGACDESLMTGESLPVIKGKGSPVLGGTVLQQGCLIVKVTALLEETALQQIIDMVSQEISHKSKYVRSVDQIVKWFVPFVMGLALMVGLVCFIEGIADLHETVLQTAITRAISVLLISCPCAIGIAAPLAESYLLNEMAKMGILVRNRGCLQYLGKETIFVFDKTGSVTEGNFKVESGTESLSFEEKRILKGLTGQSLHPVALAIHSALLSPPAPIEHFEEIVGKGIKGEVNGEKYYLGSPALFEQSGMTLSDEMMKIANHSSILTTVYFAEGNRCLSAIALGDRIRPGVEEFIRYLRGEAMAKQRFSRFVPIPSKIKTYLVSGDGEAPVRKVASACGIEQWKFGFHPAQKKDLIDKFKKEGEVVAMLGDGINDAPALTAAHVGIAAVSASDMSKHVSDLLMTTNRFQTLADLQQIARKGHKIIKQNLFWAFFYNCIGLGLAAAGLLTPLFAAFAMMTSSLMILVNSQRLAKKY